MAVEQVVPESIPTGEALWAAIRELQWAVMLLERGDKHEAEMKIHSALAWVHDL